MSDPTVEVPPNTRGPLHLVVAWASGKSIVGRSLKVAEDVADSLRMHAEAAVASLTSPAPYAADADLEDDSHFEAERSVLMDELLLEEVAKANSLPLATIDELRHRNLLCHAVLIGRADNRCMFVRKRSPIQLAKKSMIATLMDGTLDRVSTPIFAFDDRYDAIITPTKLFILNKNAFEGLFKESEAILARTGEWVDDVAQSVSMTEGSTEILVSTLRRNQFLRRKFLAVRERPHVKQMTPRMLKEEIVRNGLSVDDLMMGDQLIVTPSNVKLVLQLLNEDLFIGGFTQGHYAAGSKRSMS
ncbi:Kiwa anti-phage protein KwaB-like domain-containing protein [Mycolicibacterium sp. PDY-3]|uniref:Kiwa anti-phage protein KwaB-like domain-containing protein n=1 Tax=Mycolicibacterium sp. PDY-3 TaxID=3376069 RepID=UPI0037B6C284